LGGIGTYVKASTEKPEEVDDKANETVRIDAAQLKAQVVGEGANLGFTQRARIEYALTGGRINTDAVDNSAGVDTSDHEVNLKITLDLLQKSGVIDDHQLMFDEMTGPICDLVLADNREQSRCLSLEQRRSANNPDRFLRIAEKLEAAAFIDRELDAIPTAKTLQLRPGQCLTRPELAVLMAASKRFLTQHLQAQAALLHDHCYEPYFYAYFPAGLVNTHKARLLNHPLADAIKTTVISNRIINQAGCTFLEFAGDNGKSCLLSAVNAYLSFDAIVAADAIRQGIGGLNTVADRQYPLHLMLEQALSDLCANALNHGLAIKPEAGRLEIYRGYWEEYKQSILQQHSDVIPLANQEELPETLARQLRELANCADFPLVIALTEATGKDFGAVLDKLSAIHRALMLHQIRTGLQRVAPRDGWEQQVVMGLQTDLQRLAGVLLKKLFREDSAKLTDFLAAQPETWRRYQKLHLQVQNAPASNVLPFVVLIRSLAELVDDR
jgi:glutamate dehydrogenase